MTPPRLVHDHKVPRRAVLRAAAGLVGAVAVGVLPACGQRSTAFTGPPLYPVPRAGRWGYADADGTLVVPPRYTWADRFWGDRAVVERDGKAGYVDAAGDETISPRFRLDNPDDTAARAFGDGLAAVRVDSQWGYVDPAGSFTIAPRFAEAGDFQAGHAYASGDGLAFGLIDRDGGWVLEPRYPAMNDFAGGLAAHVRSGRWGFVDASGRERIKPAYDGAGAFTGPLAPVRRDDAWGYLDIGGRVVVEPSYAEAGGFVNGHAPVRAQDGLWGYLSLAGDAPTLRIPHRYDVAGPFLGPADALLAQVRLGDDVFYIDPAGARRLA